MPAPDPNPGNPPPAMRVNIIAPVASILDGLRPLSLETIREQIAEINQRLDKPIYLPKG